MYQLTRLLWLIGISLFLFSNLSLSAVDGKTITQQGNNNGAPACMSCHGEAGQGNASAGYPYLAGQAKAYLIKQLQDFASGKRTSPIMQAFAKALNKQEIEALADYYASLPLPNQADKQVTNTKKLAATSTSNINDKGEKLATKGKWSAGMPACFQCHGQQGQGIAPNFPAISGQPAAYIKQQLEHWRNGKRKNDPIGLMQAVAAALDENEIAAISDYLARQ